MNSLNKSINLDLEEYAEKWSDQEDDLLKELSRETYMKMLSPGMLSGPLTGNVIRLFASMIGAKNILEIGTFTGYSAICLARALPADGLLVTIESNVEIVEIPQRYFKKAGLGHIIDLQVGDALDLIPKLNDIFDFIFIDGSKAEYEKYYELCLKKLRIGGLMVVDNVLWYGKVLDTKMDNKTKAIHRFNKMVKEDSRVSNVLMPIVDGLNCVIKHA